jgi:hypothetical protein
LEVQIKKIAIIDGLKYIFHKYNTGQKVLEKLFY